MRGEAGPALIFEVATNVDLVRKAVIESSAESKQEVGAWCAAAYDLVRIRGRSMAKSDKTLTVGMKAVVVQHVAHAGVITVFLVVKI